jgi:hypothetical protein
MRSLLRIVLKHGGDGLLIQRGVQEGGAKGNVGLEDEVKRQAWILNFESDPTVVAVKGQRDHSGGEANVRQGNTAPLGWQARSKDQPVADGVHIEAEKAVNGCFEETRGGPGLLRHGLDLRAIEVAL